MQKPEYIVVSAAQFAAAASGQPANGRPGKRGGRPSEALQSEKQQAHERSAAWVQSWTNAVEGHRKARFEAVEAQKRALEAQREDADARWHAIVAAETAAQRERAEKLQFFASEPARLLHSRVLDATVQAEREVQIAAKARRNETMRQHNEKTHREQVQEWEQANVASLRRQIQCKNDSLAYKSALDEQVRLHQNAADAKRTAEVLENAQLVQQARTRPPFPVAAPEAETRAIKAAFAAETLAANIQLAVDRHQRDRALQDAELDKRYQEMAFNTQKLDDKEAISARCRYFADQRAAAVERNAQETHDRRVEGAARKNVLVLANETAAAHLWAAEANVRSGASKSAKQRDMYSYVQTMIQARAAEKSALVQDDRSRAKRIAEETVAADRAEQEKRHIARQNAQKLNLENDVLAVEQAARARALRESRIHEAQNSQFQDEQRDRDLAAYAAGLSASLAQQGISSPTFNRYVQTLQSQPKQSPPTVNTFAHLGFISP